MTRSKQTGAVGMLCIYQVERFLDEADEDICFMLGVKHPFVPNIDKINDQKRPWITLTPIGIILLGAVGTILDPPATLSRRSHQVPEHCDDPAKFWKQPSLHYHGFDSTMKQLGEGWKAIRCSMLIHLCVTRAGIGAAACLDELSP